MILRKVHFYAIDLPTNQTDFSPRINGTNDCLVADVRYGGKYHLTTLKNAGLSRCKHVCNSSPRCMGFDFYISLDETVQGSCVLSMVDHPTLLRRLNLTKVEAGAKVDDLSRMDAKRCIYFQRVRRPRKSSFTKHQEVISSTRMLFFSFNKIYFGKPSIEFFRGA